MDFNMNLNEENGRVWFTPEELRGVPEDVLSDSYKGSGEHEGRLGLSFKYPHLQPVLQYATNPETRKRLYIANENKCNQNSHLFKEAIVLRDEMAHMLGYENYACLKNEELMAKSPRSITEFLDDLKNRLTPIAEMELRRLKDLKANDYKTHGLVNDDSYYLWDHKYYTRLMLESYYNVNQLEVSEYFPVHATVSGMLKIFESVMGFVFVRLAGADLARISPTGRAEDLSWHPDTIIYSVWNDEDDSFIGYLYMDLHPRPGKYGHMSNMNVQSAFQSKDGTLKHFPATVIKCNFTKTTVDKPSLLKHHEIVTLFHELGHAIHNLAARTLYTRSHGSAGSRDFVEAPSQMLEHWCWVPSVLRSLSRHWKTGEEMPEELCQRLVATKNINSALYYLGQVCYAQFDMICHSQKTHEDTLAIEPSKLFNYLRSSVTLTQGPEDEAKKGDWGHGDAIFEHLMESYAGSYYGYLYSKVNSTDMFYSAFKKDPMSRKQGMRYRHEVLEYGGSRDELEILRGFLGRDPRSEAFYQELYIG